MNFFIIASLALNIYGFSIDDPLIVSISQLLVCLGFIYEHYQKYKISNINPIFFFSIGMLITSCTHVYAFLNIDKKETLTYNYFHYAIPEHFTLGMEIFYIGVIATTYGFNYRLNAEPVVPKISFNLPKYTNFFIFGLLSIFLVVSNNLVSLPGALQKIVDLIPLFYVFLVVRKSYTENIKVLRMYGLIVMSVLVFNAVLFAYLRSVMIMPMIVYAFAVLTTKKTLKSFFTTEIIALICVGLYLNTFFAAFGENRSGISTGLNRLSEIQAINEQSKKPKADDDNRNKQDIFARSSLINQLSQIGRVVKEDGFYEGKTLAYLAYVFIPRFLWPEKPIIQQGAWFAKRIGQAIQNEYGIYNNSINMTVYGELYLNFGYLGVVTGCFIFGMIVCQFWLVSDFNGDINNILGTGFGLTLLLTGLFQLGADMQFLITQLAIYLILLAITITFRRSNG